MVVILEEATLAASGSGQTKTRRVSIQLTSLHISQKGIQNKLNIGPQQHLKTNQGVILLYEERDTGSSTSFLEISSYNNCEDVALEDEKEGWTFIVVHVGASDLVH